MQNVWVKKSLCFVVLCCFAIAYERTSIDNTVSRSLGRSVGRISNRPQLVLPLRSQLFVQYVHRIREGKEEEETARGGFID